jgi:hypothetical protein
MGDLVFLTGDFCSGSTLLFTLFRETQEYHCLYEPLHSRLKEYLIWPLRVYEHHYFASDYFGEFKGFDRVGELFRPEWAVTNLYLTAEDKADDLYGYLSYLIETASRKRKKVLLKFNRATFRLPWLRARIYRDKESQWKSMVARVQEHLGREDVGQSNPNWEGFNVGSWCENLTAVFPELAVEHSKTGFERFSKLYDRSLAAHRAHSDLSMEYRPFCRDFDTWCHRMFDVAGCRTDPALLKHLVVPPENQRRHPARPHGMSVKAANLVDIFGRKYAKARVRLEDRWRALRH